MYSNYFYYKIKESFNIVFVCDDKLVSNLIQIISEESSSRSHCFSISAAPVPTNPVVMVPVPELRCLLGSCIKVPVPETPTPKGCSTESFPHSRLQYYSIIRYFWNICLFLLLNCFNFFLNCFWNFVFYSSRFLLINLSCIVMHV